MNKIIFINSHAAKKGRIDGNVLDTEYVKIAKIFDCGIIDRTNTFRPGFEYKVLDPLKDIINSKTLLTFGEIADQEGLRIIEESNSSNKNIQVLWSGGIDSTVALTSILKNIDKLNDKKKIEILLNNKSISEYPLFYEKYIEPNFRIIPVGSPVSSFIDPNSLIVTGELGDQLFGSDKIKPFVLNGQAFKSIEKTLPIYLSKKLGTYKDYDAIMKYLEPQVEKAPFKLVTFFDLMWWMNFTMKWQQVSLRIPVFKNEEVELTYRNLRHFFSGIDFQKWSLSNHTMKIKDDWTSYKFVAKQYIFDYTGDNKYFKNKTKEPSLKDVIVDRKRRGGSRVRVYVKENFEPIFKVFHRKENQHKFNRYE